MVLSLSLYQVSSQPPLLLKNIPPPVLHASFRHFLQTPTAPYFMHVLDTLGKGINETPGPSLKELTFRNLEEQALMQMK